MVVLEGRGLFLLSEVPLYIWLLASGATGVPRSTGSHKNEAFLELFFFLFSRMYHRPFFENVLRNKNVPPTVFPAFLKSKKNRPQIAYTPGEWS